MEKPIELRDKNTGILEIKKIIDCLTKNGYEFQRTREAVIGRDSYPNEVIVDFSKRIDYTDEVGDYLPDSSIKVSIQFEKRVDYKNITQNEDLDYIYVGKPDDFIQSLIRESNKKQRSKRRTRKTKSL